MCTSIVKIASVQGSGKGTQKWFPVTQMVVTDDHPTHAFLEHSINIDFVNEAMAPSSRVALELTPESAHTLAQAILTVLDRFEALGYPSPRPVEARIRSG